MKKLLLVLLVITIASFLFAGCLPTTPSEGEGEGEGECETTVVIDGAVVVDGKTYVSGGSHDITVTFCAPVDGNASAYITCCNGDYSKNSEPNGIDCGSEVVLFPNADKTIWTGSGYFGCEDQKSKSSDCACCASYVQVVSGECLADVCIEFPVIVDSCYPYAMLNIDIADCTCEGCQLEITTGVEEGVCAPDTECCGDDCSGLASWSVVFYDDDPFDECCDPSICEEPIGSCSGTECPFECTTECLTAGTYYAVGTMVDNVGNEAKGYAMIIITGDGSTGNCAVEIHQGIENFEWDEIGDPCIIWNQETTDTIGYCYDYCYGDLPY